MQKGKRHITIFNLRRPDMPQKACAWPQDWCFNNDINGMWSCSQVGAFEDKCGIDWITCGTNAWDSCRVEDSTASCSNWIGDYCNKDYNANCGGQAQDRCDCDGDL